MKTFGSEIMQNAVEETCSLGKTLLEDTRLGVFTSGCLLCFRCSSRNKRLEVGLPLLLVIFALSSAFSLRNLAISSQVFSARRVIATSGILEDPRILFASISRPLSNSDKDSVVREGGPGLSSLALFCGSNVGNEGLLIVVELERHFWTIDGIAP